jgi:hypothetical protein
MSKVPHHCTFYLSPYHVERTLGGYSSTVHINVEETLAMCTYYGNMYSLHFKMKVTFLKIRGIFRTFSTKLRALHNSH